MYKYVQICLLLLLLLLLFTWCTELLQQATQHASSISRRSSTSSKLPVSLYRGTLSELGRSGAGGGGGGGTRTTSGLPRAGRTRASCRSRSPTDVGRASYSQLRSRAAAVKVDGVPLPQNVQSPLAVNIYQRWNWVTFCDPAAQ